MFKNILLLFTILVYYTCKIKMTNLKGAGHDLFLILILKYYIHNNISFL